MLRRKPIQTYDFFLYQNQISNNYLLTIIRYFSQVLLNIIQYMRHVLRPTLYMMTSSNGNIFRVTGPLRVEFTDHRWIPFTKASDAELWCFFSCAWINSWVNNREAGNLSRHRTHYDIIVTRRALSIDYKLNVYINQIRHPDIRLIYTRLGAYLNILSTSRASKKQYETCPLCQSEPETVTHFILRCPFRPKDTISLIVSRTFIHISLSKVILKKLAYISDLRFPPESIGVRCEYIYIYKVYTRRERCVLWNISIPSDIWLLLSVMCPWEP